MSSFFAAKHKPLKHPGAVWMPDSGTDNCTNPKCRVKFSVSVRKHHCRWCGYIFCNTCAPTVANHPESRRCRECALPMCFMALGKPVAFPIKVNPKNVASESNGSSNKENSGNGKSPQATSVSFSVSQTETNVITSIVDGVSYVIDGTPATTIVAFLDHRSRNSLLQCCKLMMDHFPVPNISYHASVNHRFPTLKGDLAKVGSGGGGTVHFVEDNIMAGKQIISTRTLAVKVVQKSSARSFHMWKLLLREIELQQECEHPNIARLYEVFQTPTEVVLAIEAAEGRSLRQAWEIIKRQDHTSQTKEVYTAFVIKSVARALHYLYTQKKTAHRDIKLDNIVLSRDFSRVMIIDFGLAERSLSDTQQYVPLGTRGFASPENIAAAVEQKRNFTASRLAMHLADIFSLGVVAYQMLSGTKPFRSMRFHDMHRDVLQGLRCEGSRWADISPEAKQLVEWMLLHNYQQRATVSDIESHPFIQNIDERVRRIVEKRNKEWQAQEAEISNQFDKVDRDEFDDRGEVFLTPSPRSDAKSSSIIKST